LEQTSAEEHADEEAIKSLPLGVSCCRKGEYLIAEPLETAREVIFE
jgi:hypothetical protein